jgi:AMP deaminase
LDLREKYMRLSCQRLEDDPKNKPDWTIYPPPPPASWPPPPKEEHEAMKQKEKEREADPVGAVGSDFNFEDCAIPGKHQVS